MALQEPNSPAGRKGLRAGAAVGVFKLTLGLFWAILVGVFCGSKVSG